MGFFDLFRRGRGLAEEIEGLVESNLDLAAARFAAERRRLSGSDADRLSELIRRRLEAREHNEFLARALAEESISPTAGLELLETHQQAGYLGAEEAQVQRRHAFDAHRRELLRLLATPGTDRLDYFRLVDGYRAAGHLTADELHDLERFIELKLNPELAAQRLFAEAQVAVDPLLQAELLRRYLMQFQGFSDYPHAACLYLSLRIDEQWRQLATLRSARVATLRIQELNSLLHAYLPHTSDLSEYVPIDQIVADFLDHARHFEPAPESDDQITQEDVSRRVVVVSKDTGARGSYEADRNTQVPIGKTGRVRSVSGDQVLVEHDGTGFTYERSWGLPPMEHTHLGHIPRKSALALWRQDELQLMNARRPSPVFVHQYQAGVAKLASFLDRHRADNSIRLVEAGEPSTDADPQGTSDDEHTASG